MQQLLLIFLQNHTLKLCLATKKQDTYCLQSQEHISLDETYISPENIMAIAPMAKKLSKSTIIRDSEHKHAIVCIPQFDQLHATRQALLSIQWGLLLDRFNMMLASIDTNLSTKSPPPYARPRSAFFSWWLASTALAASCIAGGLYLHELTLIQQNKLLTTQINNLAQNNSVLAQTHALRARRQQQHHLIKSQQALLSLLSALSRTLPISMHLTHLAIENNSLELKGTTPCSKSVMHFASALRSALASSPCSISLTKEPLSDNQLAFCLETTQPQSG